jgi:hypothetical protein
MQGNCEGVLNQIYLSQKPNSIQSFPHINRQEPAFKVDFNIMLIYSYLHLLKTNKKGGGSLFN